MRYLLRQLERILFGFQCIFAIDMPTQKRVIARATLELPLELWLDIFQFATYVHHSTSIRPLGPFIPRRTSNNVMGVNTPALTIRTKLALVLVCRAWREVAQRFLYEHLVIRSPARANAILAVLLASRASPADGPLNKESAIGYGRWPIHIEIFTHARGTGDVRYLQTLFHIFQCCPKLKILSGSWLHPLPTEFLNAIAALYGQTLQGLYWNEVRRGQLDSSYTSTTPKFLSSFQNLQVLDLRRYVGCDVAQQPDPLSIPQPTLPCVTDLILSTRQGSLHTASLLSLPRLRNLTLCISLSDCQAWFKPRVPYHELRKFIAKHGQSLVSVDLSTPAPHLEPDPDSSHSRYTVEHIKPDVFLEPDACPNLVSLVFPVTSDPISPQVHPNLRRIGLRGVKADNLYPDKSSNARTHLNAITRKLYPLLQEVRTVGYLVDADTDNLIKDVFIWWVEKFERHGIDFLDGEGVLWAYTDPVDGGIEEDTFNQRVENDDKSKVPPMVILEAADGHNRGSRPVICT